MERVEIVHRKIPAAETALLCRSSTPDGTRELPSLEFFWIGDREGDSRTPESSDLQFFIGNSKIVSLQTLRQLFIHTITQYLFQIGPSQFSPPNEITFPTPLLANCPQILIPAIESKGCVIRAWVDASNSKLTRTRDIRQFHRRSKGAPFFHGSRATEFAGLGSREHRKGGRQKRGLGEEENFLGCGRRHERG